MSITIKIFVFLPLEFENRRRAFLPCPFILSDDRDDPRRAPDRAQCKVGKAIERRKFYHCPEFGSDFGDGKNDDGFSKWESVVNKFFMISRGAFPLIIFIC